MVSSVSEEDDRSSGTSNPDRDDLAKENCSLLDKVKGALIKSGLAAHHQVTKNNITPHVQDCMRILSAVL